MLVDGISSAAVTPLTPSAVSPAAAGDASNFARGDRASASVRLRSKSRKGNGGEADGGRAADRGRLLSRHSGDFGHFNAASKMELAPPPQGGHPTDDDWAYITYPNGVPTVQEVRELAASDASEMPKRTPVKVVTREVPGISLAGLKLSADVGGNGATDSPTSTASSSSSKNRFRNGRNSNSPAAAAASTVAAKSSEDNVRFRRRLSEQPPNAAAASMASASSKRCSGEFQFVRTAKNGLVGDGGGGEVADSEQGKREAPKCRTPSRGVAARGPGLGRRAATQGQIERGERKNSYSSAMYKSQDNLVKASVMSDDASLEKSTSGDAGSGASACTLRKGLLWQQRDKIFSRWKERFFVLTPDYLNCFKRGTSRMSEMGEFLFKLRMSEIDDVELLDKRGYLTICVSLVKDGKVYLRKTEGIREWFRAIRDCHRDSLQKRRVAENPASSPANAFWQRKQMTDSTSIEQWMANRKKKLLQHQTSLTHLASAFSDSTPDIATRAAAVAGGSNGAGEPRITLDELSDLYRRAESDRDPAVDAAIPPGEDTEQQQQNRLLSSVVSSPLTAGVKLRIKDGGGVSGGGAGGRKIINRLSLMSDIELPDFGDLDRGVFLKKKKMLDSHSNSDSGNNSISTNASVGSSGSANSKDLKDVDVGRDQPTQQHPLHPHPRQQLPHHHQQHRASQPPPPPSAPVTNGVQMRQRSRDNNNSCHDRLFSHAQHLPQQHQQHPRYAPHHGAGDDRPNLNIKHVLSKQQMQQQIRNHRRASAYGALGGNNGVQITHV